MSNSTHSQQLLHSATCPNTRGQAYLLPEWAFEWSLRLPGRQPPQNRPPATAQGPGPSCGSVEGISEAEKTSGDFLKEKKLPTKAAEKTCVTLINGAATVNHRTWLCGTVLCPPGGRAVKNAGNWLKHQHPTNEVGASSPSPRDPRAVVFTVRCTLRAPTRFLRKTVQTNPMWTHTLGKHLLSFNDWLCLGV